VTDSQNRRVQVFDPDGGFERQLGGPGSGLARPSGIDVGPDGLVYVTDPDTDSVHVLDPEGESHRSWGGYGSGDGQFQNPWAIAV